MRFIHCSDLHLDSRMEALSLEKTAVRREEITHTFERLVSYAKENGVTAVIIAGDMFDTSRVTIKTKNRIIKAIECAPEVDFLYLSGNHDDDNFISELEVLPKNLKVFRNEWTEFTYGDIVISGIVFTSTNVRSVYDSLNLQPKNVNILVMHGQVAGYNSEEKAEIISIPLLKDKNVDYLALGHIHSYSEGVIDNRGTYAYSGCLDGRGFDETGEKGFILLEVDNKKIKKSFVPFSSRVLCEIEYDVQNCSSWLSARDDLIEKVTKELDKSSLLKVVLKGRRKPDFDIDKIGLTTLLEERFFFAKVYDKTQLDVDLNDYALDKSVRGEFVRAVWQSNMSLEEKTRVIMCGINALNGEDF